MQIRRINRRRVAAALVALTAAVAVPAALEAVTSRPAPQYVYYYSNELHTTPVGVGEWDCNLEYHQVWGTTSLYMESVYIYCGAED